MIREPSYVGCYCFNGLPKSKHFNARTETFLRKLQRDASAKLCFPSPRPSPSGRYSFRVAQIFNLPYRRFVIGRTFLAGGRWQVKNLRYSRLQVRATGPEGALNTYSPR